MPNPQRAYQGRHNGSGIQWTADMESRLRALWDSGLSGSEIGRLLGVSKYSAVSKAHRIGLPGRPSPIHRGPQRRPPGRWLIARMNSLASACRRSCEVGPPPTRCQWIEGEPTASDDCKCLAPILAGSSYCPAHHRRCWQKSTSIPAIHAVDASVRNRGAKAASSLPWPTWPGGCTNAASAC